MNRPSFICRFTSPKLPAAALLVSWLWLHASLLALPGDLDPSFNGTGRTRFDFGPGDDGATAAAVQADGKLIVAGAAANGSESDFAVTRYNEDGSADQSFGNGGHVLTRVGEYGGATAVAVQPDGKIVVAGSATLPNDYSSEFAVVRYNTDGSLDTSFGEGGIVMTPIGDNTDYCSAIALQPDGRIILAGSAAVPGGEWDLDFDFLLVRYHPDGSLDTSFGGDGIVITQLTPRYDNCNAVVFLPDGRIIAAGSVYIGESDSDFVLVRYLPDGELDTSFGDDGIITTAISSTWDAATALAVQPGNPAAARPDRIVAAGSSSVSGARIAIVRYDMNGFPDSSFGGDGIVTTTIGSHGGPPAGLIVEGTGSQPRRILVAASSNEFPLTLADFGILRLLEDGSPDISFGTGGKMITSVGPGEDSCRAMAMQNGKLCLAGQSYLETADFAVMRCNSNGTLDSTFDGDGIRTENLATHPSAAKCMVLQEDGKTVTGGASIGRGFAIARCHPDGALDNTFGNGGKRIETDFGYQTAYNATGIQPDGKLVFAGTRDGGSGNIFAVTRYLPDGSPDISFSDDGKLVTVVGQKADDANAMFLQPDGKIVVAGSTQVKDDLFGQLYSDFAVVRYLSDGSLDPSFDFDGIASAAVGNWAYGYAAVLQETDGKIIVGGLSAGSGPNSFALVRFRPNGSLDPTFGGFGQVVTTIGSASACQALGIQADGKIVAAGYTTNASKNDFAIVRYLQDGSPDSSFGTSGKVVTSITAGDDGIQSLVIQPDGRIVVAGYSGRGLAARSDFTIARYNPDGSLDTGYGVNGFVRIDIHGDDAANAIALDAVGNCVVAGDAGGFFCVARVLGGDLPNEPPAVEIVRPAQGEVLSVGENVRFAVSVADQTTLAAPVVEFFLDGQSAGVDATSPYTLDWIATQGAHVLRVTARDSFGLTTQSTGRLFFAAAPVIARNGHWKYSAGWFDPGATWRATNFDDGWWDSGQAELGFGDGDEITALPPEDRFQWAPTYYFRRRFFVPNTATANYATAHLLRDDGAAVYLNGQRIGLFNLPEPYDNETPALENLPNRAGNEEAEDSFALPPELLTPGENILAVEVHQAVEFPRTQYDLSFALSLSLFSYDPGQVLTSTVIDGKVTLRWPDYLPDWNLQRSVDLATWEIVSTGPVVSGAFFTFEVPPNGPAKREFFRLRKALP